VVDIIEVQERCIRSPALTVGRRTKYHSSPQKEDPFTAANASRNIDHRAEIDGR
jgi:hypothetical protein